MELDPVVRITADAVGEPGRRTFFLQASGEDARVTVVLEKEQVRLLAASILEILQRVGTETDPDAIAADELALEDPGEGDWRAGRLSIGYHEDRDLLVLDIEELAPEVDEGDEDAVDDEDERVPNELRVWATREQMLALARHAAAVVTSGRPNCPFCGHPIDPEGHLCPATNGHREIGSV